MTTTVRALVCGILLAACAGGGTAAADDYHVPDEYDTIGKALEVASSGDRVLIAPGHYEETDLWIPDGVEVMGSGPAWTEIWGMDDHITFEFEGSGSLFGVWIHGGRPAVQAIGAGIDVTVDSCWFGPVQDAIWFDLDGASRAVVGRSVFYADPGGLFVVGAVYHAPSEVHVHNNHFVSIFPGHFVGLHPEGGGDGITAIHNNIFENFGQAIDLNLIDVGDAHQMLVINNVFHTGDLGLWLAGPKNSPDTALDLHVFNNWFVAGDAGIRVDNLAFDVTIEHHNAYFGNVDDVQNGVVGNTSFTGEAPQFAGAFPNDQHDDDYRLLAGTFGIDVGFGIPSGPSEYMDPDGSTPDIGAHGGPAAWDWNWDGDPVGHVDGDCDDLNPNNFPGNHEDCEDSLDNDCDDLVDMDDPDCEEPGDDDGGDDDGGDDDGGDDDGGDDDDGDDDAADDDDGYASGFLCECQVGTARAGGGLAVIGLVALWWVARRR